MGVVRRRDHHAVETWLGEQRGGVAEAARDAEVVGRARRAAQGRRRRAPPARRRGSPAGSAGWCCVAHQPASITPIRTVLVRAASGAPVPSGSTSPSTLSARSTSAAALKAWSEAHPPVAAPAEHPGARQRGRQRGAVGRDEGDAAGAGGALARRHHGAALPLQPGDQLVAECEHVRLDPLDLQRQQPAQRRAQHVERRIGGRPAPSGGRPATS